MIRLKYWGFITYSHRDIKFVKWLHRRLETYRVPRSLVGTPGYEGPVPPRIFPFFRDRDELSTSTDLGQAIETALRESSCLIVVCSPSAVGSAWVNEEILRFKRLGREQRIFPIIVDGEPNAGHARASLECFPHALRFRLDPNGEASSEPVEPVAADIREEADGRRNALLKLIAAILAVDFDRLRRRDQQRRQRRLAASAVTGLALTLLMGILALLAWQGRNEAERQRLVAEDKTREARHQLGLAMVEKAVRLDRDHRQLSAALLSARALGMDQSAGAYLYPNVPAWDTAMSLAKATRVLKPTWRSSYRLMFGSRPNVAFDWEGALIVRSQAGILRLDARTDRRLQEPWKVPANTVATMAISPDARFLAMRTYDGKLSAWNLQRGEVLALPEIAIRSSGSNDAHAVALSLNGRYLATVTDRQVILADIQAQSSKSLPEVAEDIFDLMFSPEGRFLVVRGVTQVRCWNVVESRWQWAVRASPGGRNGLWPAAFSPGGELIGVDAKGLVRVSIESGSTLGHVPLDVEAHRVAF
jgi:hypothetical protein